MGVTEGKLATDCADYTDSEEELKDGDGDMAGINSCHVSVSVPQFFLRQGTVSLIVGSLGLALRAGSDFNPDTSNDRTSPA